MMDTVQKPGSGWRPGPRLWLGALALLLIGGAVALYALLVVPDGVDEAAADHVEAVDSIATAKIAIQNRMTDATSITFGKVAAYPVGNAEAVCGLVDIVEPDDTFDGEERFTYLDGELSLEELDGTDVVQQKWRDLCN